LTSFALACRCAATKTARVPGRTEDFLLLRLPIVEVVADPLLREDLFPL
jgi:hypothetical protein